ncbi:MAG: pantetheine-phosphate adenylyltransferase [Candidatus Kapabacteria bacterium]|nr:pantetheine-phosphate adenylyltransferase [Ignavibacteriota bacterium]MCW5884959.1 pantetheine-phosphate adenylyltransferase [Candidatus Kapabacteria bacterium]
MSKSAIYAGTFDPITNGHVDVIERACEMFDKVYVVIAVNSKKVTLFSEEERLEMIKSALEHLPNADVIINHKLTVEVAEEKNAIAMVRGIRAVSDFEYEFQIALMNRKLSPNIYTVFLTPHEKYTYLNSSIIREMAKYGKDTSEFVPHLVAAKLKEKFNF